MAAKKSYEEINEKIRQGRAVVVLQRRLYHGPGTYMRSGDE